MQGGTPPCTVLPSPMLTFTLCLCPHCLHPCPHPQPQPCPCNLNLAFVPAFALALTVWCQGNAHCVCCFFFFFISFFFFAHADLIDICQVTYPNHTCTAPPLSPTPEPVPTPTPAIATGTGTMMMAAAARVKAMVTTTMTMTVGAVVVGTRSKVTATVMAAMMTTMTTTAGVAGVASGPWQQCRVAHYPEMMSLPATNPQWACIGWHTGTVQVGMVQPTPVPMKPAPVAGFTCTHTTNPQVSATLQVPRVVHRYGPHHRFCCAGVGGMGMVLDLPTHANTTLITGYLQVSATCSHACTCLPCVASCTLQW